MILRFKGGCGGWLKVVGWGLDKDQGSDMPKAGPRGWGANGWVCQWSYIWSRCFDYFQLGHPNSDAFVVMWSPRICGHAVLGCWLLGRSVTSRYYHQNSLRPKFKKIDYYIDYQYFEQIFRGFVGQWIYVIFKNFWGSWAGLWPWSAATERTG